MYSKLLKITTFLIALALIGGSTPVAQAQAPPPSASATATVAAATASLHGHIADPTGALIPGATVVITTSAGTAVTKTTADATGAYLVNGLKPGSYIVQASYTGFAPFSSPNIALTAGQSKRVDISMAIEAAQQSVTVTEDQPTVSVDPEGNSSAIVIKGKDLEALSDDPDELSNELTALAGPSAGPNGGQIYIDGFTGGQLPPKSAIREIRINQNPFSAEFDKLGYGRIEILTKPGTDKLHGQFFSQGTDSAFDTNPLNPNIPPFHSVQFNGTLNGSLSKWASFFISGEQRNNQNDSVYTFNDNAPILDATTGLYIVGSLSGGLFTPQTRTNISPRIDLQLGQKNTLTVRYQFFRNSESGELGGTTSAPSQATSETSTESTVQISDSEVINDHLVNETRFQYLRDYSSTTPVSTTPQVSAAGASFGGSSGQSSNDHTNHLELQNITTMTVGAQAIKFGTRLRDNRDANTSNAGVNGSFTFQSTADYVGALNEPSGVPCPLTPSTTDPYPCVPSKLTYAAGTPNALTNVFDAALFFQDDWKANKNLTLSGGVRWESQNHISDHDDWAPRVSFAYALDGHKDSKQAKTVLRGGFGTFYDRFTISQMLNVERYNGATGSRQQFTIDNPTCFSPTALTISGNCSSATATSSIYQVAPHYHSPYTEQAGASLERQLTKAATLTATYLHSFGAHQFVLRDSNAYLPGTYQYGSTTLTGVRPNPSEGIVDQYYSEAVFKQNQLIINLNAHFSPNFSVVGFYNFTTADSDGGGGSSASNSYDLSQDYGRAGFASRNMVFLMANYQGPWGLRFNPFLIAQSGKPFNITSPNDLTGDNFFNNRPSYATTASNPDDVVQTAFGALDTVPQPGETVIPAYLGNGPAAVAFNLRLSRAFGLGPKLASANAAGGPPPGGPGGGGGHGGGGFGGPFGGGGRGMGGMGPAPTGRKYTLTFSAQALNLFNDVNYGQPLGSLQVVPDPTTGLNTPGSQFGKSTGLAGGIFSSGSAARRVFFQAVIAF
ncbi:MAG: carboxypeptidase regulatory-like domain-containing protein [Terracidiphilus sp.]